MPLKSRNWAVLLVLCGLAGGPACAQGDKNADDARGRVASKPLFRDPVHDGAADPVLIWNRADRKWLMFYTNRRANVPDTPGVSWVHGTRIGLAESSDGGATWEYQGTVDIPYGKSDYSHWAPEVIEHGGTYHMYLSIVPGIFRDWNAPRDIIHLISKDLKKWKYESTLDLGSDRVIDATVFQLPNRTWRMWYKDERSEAELSYADSPDLFSWTARGNAIGDRSGEGAKVFRWKGWYWMVADMWDGLGVYRSKDLVTWNGQPDNLLKDTGTYPTDRVKGHHADVVLSGDRAFLFYFTHQVAEDCKPNDPFVKRRTVIQVVELEYRDGKPACDRNQPTRVLLRPGPGA